MGFSRQEYQNGLVAQMVKNLPTCWRPVQSLSQEDPLEEEMATHANILPRESHEERSLAGYSLSEVVQSCLTLCDPVDCSPPGSSVHGILQARIQEWVAISFSSGIFLTQGSNPGLP